MNSGPSLQRAHAEPALDQTVTSCPTVPAFECCLPKAEQPVAFSSWQF